MTLLEPLKAFSTWLVALAILATSFACTKYPTSGEESAVTDALRRYLVATGWNVPDRVESIPPHRDFPRPPVASGSCFPDGKPDEGLISAFEQANESQGLETGDDSVEDWIDTLAAKIVGTEPEIPQRLGVSRSGFNPERTRVLVYAELFFPLAGFGSFFLGERQPDGNWTIVGTCVIEVS